MKTEVIVFCTNHYDMTSDNGGKGATIKVLGDNVSTNNSYGVSVTDAETDYEEIAKVVGEVLPARYSAKVSMIPKKLRNGKEAMVLKLSDLTYICPVDIVDAKK